MGCETFLCRVSSKRGGGGGRYGARGGGGGGVGGWGALALPMEMSLPEEVVNFGLLQPPYLFLSCKT